MMKDVSERVRVTRGGFVVDRETREEAGLQPGHLATIRRSCCTIPTSRNSRKTTVRTGFLEKPDYDRLLAELPSYLKIPLVIAYHTGCSLGEVSSLQWRDVNLTTGEIIIHAEHAKNKKHRVLPIYDDMIDTLKQQKSERDEKYPRLEWVFHDGNGKRLRAFYKAWKSASERANLDTAFFMTFGAVR